MLNKEKLTNHIKNIELKNKVSKVLDKVSGVLKNYDVRCSEFLNPYELKNILPILNSIDDIKYTAFGGYDKSERKMICIYPYYVMECDIDIPIRIIQIKGNFLFCDVAHKDFLGAVLSLGIKREKIGDILINDGFAQMVVSKDISDFVMINLTKIANVKVKIQIIDSCEIIIRENEYKEINFNVTSLRIDNVISSMCNISRSCAEKIINSKRVSIDFEMIESRSTLVYENNVISIRGSGRYIIDDTSGISRKDKIRVKARKLL